MSKIGGKLNILDDSNPLTQIAKTIVDLCKDSDAERIWKEIRRLCSLKYFEVMGLNEVYGGHHFQHATIPFYVQEYLKKSKGLTPRDVEIRLRKEHNEIFTKDEYNCQMNLSKLGWYNIPPDAVFPVALIANPVQDSGGNIKILDHNKNVIVDGYQLRVYTGVMSGLKEHRYFDEEENLDKLKLAGIVSITEKLLKDPQSVNRCLTKKICKDNEKN